MESKPLSENWKDYSSWDAIGGISGRSLTPDGDVAIHSPAGWWHLWQDDGKWWHRERFPGGVMRSCGYRNILDAIRGGNRGAPKFKNFAAFVSDLNDATRSVPW